MQEIERLKLVKLDNPRFKFGIDRDEENKDVREYVATGDQQIFNKIYQRRKPTIEYLSKKYHWLTEDAASEIRIVLVRTVNSYGKNGKKTDFNTFFFSSVKNHFSNLAKKRYRKKRTTIEGLDPLNRMIPLDSCIGDDDSSSMHEFVSNDHENITEHFDFKNLIFKMSKGNKYVEEMILGICDMKKREIMREELIFSLSFPLISGDISSDIESSIGFSSDIYTVISSSIEGGEINARICLDGAKFISYLARNISEMKLLLKKNRGI